MKLVFMYSILVELDSFLMVCLLKNCILIRLFELPDFVSDWRVLSEVFLGQYSMQHQELCRRWERVGLLHLL